MQVLAVADENERETLQTENIPNPLEQEQSIITDEELKEAESKRSFLCFGQQKSTHITILVT